MNKKLTKEQSLAIRVANRHGNLRGGSCGGFSTATLKALERNGLMKKTFQGEDCSFWEITEAGKAWATEYEETNRQLDRKAEILMAQGFGS